MPLNKTLCANCATAMACGANEKSCWCQALPSLPSSHYQAQKSCLCSACLRAEILRGCVLFGIANCDTVKKARAYLTEQNLPYSFWDFKKHGLPEDQLDIWLNKLGWENVLNRKGTSWRGLSDEVKAHVVDTNSAKAAMLQNPSLIKRPIVHWPASHTHTVGFDAQLWQNHIPQEIAQQQ